MDKLFDYLLKMPDKIAHIIVCFVGSIPFGFSFGLGASLAAEFKDRAHGGRWDWMDFLAGMLGTILGGLIHFVIIKPIFALWK